MKNKAHLSEIKEVIHTFLIPLIVFLGILISLVTSFFHLSLITSIVLLTIISIGSFQLITETIQSLLKKQFALDYIALLAITVGVVTGNYLVAAVIVLMLSGGNKLEEYAMNKAKTSLTALADRIPHTILLAQTHTELKIEEATVGTHILVRKGEVIPLDGILLSEFALVDESSLTGEPYMIEKKEGDILRSGTVNTGSVIEIKVTKIEKDSTYRKIIEMVNKAQSEKSPIIRLADKYSTVFTIITFTIAAVAYAISHDFNRVLAVLVIATPCPLILATPIALMGGMNSAAKRRIIIKRLASIEVLSRISAIIFDKTGTITLGKPILSSIQIINSAYTPHHILSIAAAIERNSLHPLAKAIVVKAKQEKISIPDVNNIQEEIGKGITGDVDGKTYVLAKGKEEGMTIEVSLDRKIIALLRFEDQLKEGTKHIVDKLHSQGLELAIYTGDKQKEAQKVAAQLGVYVQVKAECSPQDKQEGVRALHHLKKTVAMVGDGINDAPALALADVGMVFSSDEHTAASEAADVVFLGGDFTSVSDVYSISKKTIYIAQQSIFIGIGVSTLGMICAASGFIPPITGAFIQEAIDIAVIFNALRTSRI